MILLKEFVSREMGYSPEQVQIFTPTPSTISTAMYYSGYDSPDGEKVFVETSFSGRSKQKLVIAHDRRFRKQT
jgi:radical SAM superfamily enzyme YgiQ (UPF0313 family)